LYRGLFSLWLYTHSLSIVFALLASSASTRGPSGFGVGERKYA